MSATTLGALHKNPLPTIAKSIGKILLGVFMAIVAFGESAGRARAASELARQGLYKEAQALMMEQR